MSGIGTKEKLVLEILCHRTADDMAALNAAYKQVRQPALCPLCRLRCPGASRSLAPATC